MSLDQDRVRSMPTVGRMVHFVGPRGETVAAVVTAITNRGQVNLQLFLDGVNHAHILPYAYDVDYGAVPPTGLAEPGTWHWPERC